MKPHNLLSDHPKNQSIKKEIIDDYYPTIVKDINQERISFKIKKK